VVRAKKKKSQFSGGDFFDAERHAISIQDSLPVFISANAKRIRWILGKTALAPLLLGMMP
jgi:hypothetical protein